jgi:hypothetical protein
MKMTPFRLVCVATLMTGSAWLYGAATQADTMAATKCQVCHNDKHPHTVTMPCDKVTKYLQNHPGDYAGQCQNVSSEKPPRPTPTPKPPKPAAPADNQPQQN